MIENRTENNFVAELKSNENAAFQSLVEQFQDKVINTCYRFVQNKEDAEDVAQEVFIGVYQSISGFKEQSQLSTWIYRIAVTKSLEFIRRRRRKKRFGQVKRVFGFCDESEEIQVTTGTNPHSDMENKERVQILQSAVNSLPDNQKIAITLNKYEGFSYSETAEIMGTSVTAVESLLHRAKKNLNKKLYHYYEKNL